LFSFLEILNYNLQTNGMSIYYNNNLFKSPLF